MEYVYELLQEQLDFGNETIHTFSGQEAEEEIDKLKQCAMAIDILRKSQENSEEKLNSAEKTQPCGETNKDIFQLLTGIKSMLDGGVVAELNPDSQFHEKLNAVIAQQKHV